MGPKANGKDKTALMAELAGKLREYLPKEAIKQHPTKTYLSSINPMYVVERLNDVFGENGWEAEYRLVEQGPMVVMECRLKCYPPEQPDRPILRQTFGGNDNKDLGDAYKGACTDALTKAASQIGIGSEVYKGIYDGKTPLVDKKVERGFKKEYEKRTADQVSRNITAAEAKVFLAACNKGGKTKEQVEARLKAMKIGKLSEMRLVDFEAEIKWATGMEADFTDTLTKSLPPKSAEITHNFPKLFAKAREKGIPEHDLRQLAHEVYKVESMKDLTHDQFEAVIEWVDQQEGQSA